MQPLRGYDSLSLGNLLQGAVPAPLYSLDVQNTDDSLDNSAPTAVLPQRRGGLTYESVAALKQAMSRIAPYLPPDVLQRHYINRLAELSNPTPATLYPVASNESSSQSDETTPAHTAAALSAPNAESQNPFAAAALASLTQRGIRPIQPISEGDPPASIANLIGSVTPRRLSAPNIMDDPVVSAARARFATSPAARGHIQSIPGDALVSADDVRGQIGALPSSRPEYTAATPGRSKYGQTVVTSRWPHTMTERYLTDAWNRVDPLARLVPVLGPSLDLADDRAKGDAIGETIDLVLLRSGLAAGSVLKKPIAAAWTGFKNGEFWKEIEPWWKKEGSHEWSGTRKEKFKDGVASWYKAMNEIASAEPVHHWLITQAMQRNWPTLFPKWLTNQPWNLMSMKRASELGKTAEELHGGLHGYKKEAYILDKDPVENARKLREYGRPDWANIAIPAYKTMAVGNVAKTVRNK